MQVLTRKRRTGDSLLFAPRVKLLKPAPFLGKKVNCPPVPAKSLEASPRSHTLNQRLVFPDRSFAAFLFDMDGTILSSIAAAERVWTIWARRHGLDVAALMASIHGVRSVDTIRRLALPGVDPEAEAAALTLMRDRRTSPASIP